MQVIRRFFMGRHTLIPASVNIVPVHINFRTHPFYHSPCHEAMGVAVGMSIQFDRIAMIGTPVNKIPFDGSPGVRIDVHFMVFHTIYER